MSNSSEFSDKASGNRTTSSEKSSFTVTCNRLREYLKENGSLRDVNRGFALAGGDSGFGISSAIAPNTEALPRSLSSFNLFPQGSVTVGIEDATKDSCAAMQPEKAQMTIFYGGQVMVFNDMPASKAMKVMHLASIAGSQATGVPASAAGLSLTPHESITKFSQPILVEIPIARKQSLARFLEKRKDRIMASSPYTANNMTKGGRISPSMPADKSWLGLAGS